jgi:hypothetical protein
MATSQEYAAWLRANQNKQGTPDYQTVLRAFQEARLEELQTQAAPPPTQPQPESGFMPALRSGIEGLMGAGAAFAGRTGLMDMAEAEKAVEARRQRQAEIFKPTEEWGLTKLSELLGGSIPYMAAPLAAAGAAAALPLTGTAAAVAGLGAAGLASATQFTGTNLSRQIEEGKKLADTDLGNAALAAVPMALLDTLSMRMLPGVGKLLGDAGIKVTKETAKEVSEQILKKAAIDYTTATGRAMTSEGLTEAAQQGFERLQAGLSLTDADARKEYFDSLVGGALLGGTIAPAGRMLERGKAKREVAAIEQEEADAAAKAAREAEEERKQQPEYMEGLYTTYQDLLAQKKALDAQIKKGSKEAPLSQDDKDANSVINRQLAELKQPLKRAQQAFIDAGGPQALAAARTRQLQPTPEEVPGTEQALEEQRRERLLAELDRAQLIGDTKRASALQQQLQESAPESPEALRSRLTRDVPYLQALLERQREQIQAAETPEAAAEIAARAQKTYEALAQANARLGELPQAPDIAELQQKEQALLKVFEDAREAGDQEAVLKVVPELQEARRQLQEARRQLQEAQPFDLTSEAYAAEEDRKRAELGEAMGAGREIATAEREQAGTEQAVAREQAARSAALQEQLDFEGTAEREAMQELAADRAADMRARELARLRTAPQLALFPEQREQVVRTEVEQTERERPAEVTPLRSELARLLRERRGLERQATQAQPAPGAELAGPASLFVNNARDQIRTLDTRIAEIEEQLTGLMAPGVETRRQLQEAPQPDLRPQGPLAERLNTLAERVLLSPQVDEDTKALVREVQDNLPFLLRRDPVAQRTLGRRGALLAGQQEGQSVGAWLYRTLQGTAPPELTENIRDRLRELEAARRSETEQVTQYAQRALTPEEKKAVTGTTLAGRRGVMTREPTGELRRAVQTEIEMPEPTAKAFASFGDFSDYLASEGLQAYRLQKGLVFPTLANIQKRLAPIQARVDELQKQLADVNAKREALQKADAAERSSASELLQESQQKLQALVQTLDDTARTTYVGQKYKQVDLVDLLDQAHGRLNAALAHSSNLRQQFAQALNNLTSAEEAAKPVMVDASGDITTKADEAIRTVAKGQLPVYRTLSAAVLDLQKKGRAFIEADQRLERVVKSGIGQSWDAGSPTLRAYISAKKAKDEAQRTARQAQYVLLQTYRRIPTEKALNDSLSKFLSEKASLDAEMAKAAKSLSAIRLEVRNASNRLNDSYVKMENIPELQFGDNLLRLRQDLLTAQNISEETMGRSVERQAQAEQLAREASAVAQPMRTMKRQVESTLGEARERAEARRGVPAKETQGEREARDAALRREEQARLERQEATPGTRIEFEREGTRDTTLDSLIVKAEMAKTREARAAVVKETQDYLNARVANLDNDLKEMARNAAKNLKDYKTRRAQVARLTERLEKNVTEKGRQMTPRQRETAERNLADAKQKLAKHKRLYTMNTREMKIKRTDIQAERAAKKQALADVQARFEPGQRLGEAEGTTAGRAIGPVTRPEVYPPKTMRTGSEESRTGVTTTDARSRLTEARGAKQRDIAMTSEEMQAAEQAAAEMKTLEGLEKAEKALAAERAAANERGLRPGEFDRFEAREEILKARRAALEREAAAAKPAEAKPAEAKPAEAKPPAPEVAPEVEQRKRAQEANRIAQELAQKPAEPEAEAPGADVEEEVEEAPKESKKVKTAKARAEKVVAAIEGAGGATVDKKSPARKKALKAAVTTKEGGVKVTRYPYQGRDVTKREEELDSFNVEILPGENREVFSSRGATAEPSTVDSVRAELSKAFSNLGRVQIYDTVGALVKANPQYKGKIPSDARGFVDAAGNKAFLIAENINQGQAMSVLLHEVGAHIGLKTALGAGQYDTLVNAVKSWEKRNDGSKEAQVAKAARARVEAAETPAGQVNDELLAYAIEEAVNAGVKPTETKGVLGQWLGRVAALFRRALEKFGLPPKALDAQGIVDMAFGAAKMEMRGQAAPAARATEAPAARATEAASAGEILFSRNLPTASRVANDLIGKQPTWLDNLKANFLGLGARTQFIDKYAPTEEALKRGKVEELKANQARYYLRMYDQRMHFTSQAISDGAPVIVEKTRRDGRPERVVETAPGANIEQIVDILKRKNVVKEAGSADAANKLFTLYLAAIRGERVGFDKLNFSKLNAADIKAAKAEIDANPVLSEAFREARDVYNAYNRNLMKFAMDAGSIGKDLGNKLLSTNDYIPYYRMRDGVAQLMIGGETPIRIGNIKDSPHLQELVGGDEAIFDFLTSSVQNTSMLIDMSMKNLATKNLMFELRDVGLAKIAKVKGGNAPTGSVTFKKDGEEYFAVVDTDALGIDSELLVKGLAGIPTMFPQMIRVLGMPARLLRRLIVASPVYMARQLVRDSTAAAIASGANMTPIVSALRQIGKPSVLERRGITGGQVFTGMPEDQTRLLKEMQAGKIGLTSGLARLEALSAKADALTREAQYQSYREQGLSEMEATLMALESMNFSRRGLSPTMHMLSTLIPFFNAQIQGLDVLYRSLRGDMPFNEQLEVRKKLVTRGAMLFGMSMVYAAMMQDDEAYKNAKVEEKYSNFFIPIPGTEQPLRIPIPFELGYIFKALPEALVNTFAREEGGEEALKALTFIAKQTVPGLSSYFLPQAVKPALEVALDQSIYTGRDIESAKEKLVEPGYRFRDTTPELVREVGEMTGLSPVKLEYLIRGYTGGMGMALVQAVSAPFGSTGPEAATKRPSDVPVVGTLFQPADASGIIDFVYERMNKARQVQETYEALVKKGRPEAAQAYLDRNLDSFALASLAGSFKQQMGEITQYEQSVRASSLTADQKREALDRARQAKINLAKAVRAASDRTERQAAPA